MIANRCAWGVVLGLAWSTALAGVVACSNPKDEADCSSGVCKAPGSAGSSGSAGTNGGGTGIISVGGNAGSGGSGAGGTNGGGAGTSGGAGGAGGSGVPSSCGTGAACQESWSCSPWETKLAPTKLPSGDNAGVRSCTDVCKCGTTKSKPAEKATLPALDMEFYQCEMEPIFDGFCAQLACHGSEKGHRLRVYARAKLRVSGETWTSNVCGDTNEKIKSETCIGSNECQCWQLPHSLTEWQRNYDAARGFALDAQGKPLANMATSELVRSGLAPDAKDCDQNTPSTCLPKGQQALPHAGIVLYSGTGIVYAKMLDWLAQPSNGGGKGCVTPSQKEN